MRNHAIQLDRTLAAAAIAIGLAFSSGHARADDDVQSTMTASSATGAGNTRPIVLQAMTTGGLRRGEVMVITPGRSEILSPTQYAQQVFSAPKAGANAYATF